MVPVSSFPLLRLPNNATIVTLSAMDNLELLGISLASKKTKGLVQSLRIKASELIVYIARGGSFSIRLKIPLQFLCIQSFKFYEDVYYHHYSNLLDRRTFIDHLKFIFNTEKIKVDFGSNSQLFDFEPILKDRRDIESVCLITDNQEEHRRILNIMKPSIVTIHSIFELKEILFQNVDYLRARDMIIGLEDLLGLNIRNFSTFCPMVPARVLNRFLKLWTRGSNLQLESLKLHSEVDKDFMIEDIFDRLKTTQYTTVRYFKSAKGTRKITDGLDISRFDGTMATILLLKLGQLTIDFVFEMFVWHDHCIAKETDL
ncbi:unnamed protein product [Caenorhabditis brenneri]